jgi:LacI family transcriptional regulator
VLRRGQSSHLLGLVIGDVGNPFYAELARAVEEVARRHDYLLITASSDEDPARERDLLRSLCERRVSGLLVVPAPATDHRFLLPEMRLGTDIVFVDRPPENLEADVVLVDNVDGARRATEHLLEHGHRRIAMVGDMDTLFTAADRHRGYLEALANAGVPRDDRLVRLGSRDAAAAEEATRQLLALPDPPTAVFAGNNLNAVGVLRALAGRDEIAVVAFDDFEAASLLKVTVVDQQPTDIGRQAAELLCQRLHGYSKPPERIVMPTRLIPRGTGEVGLPRSMTALDRDDA